MNECRKYVGELVTYGRDMYEVVKNSDVIFHVTEWKEFRMPDWDNISHSMRILVLIDGRNVYSTQELKGMKYLRIG